jgi:hypothetical protein
MSAIFQNRQQRRALERKANKSTRSENCGAVRELMALGQGHRLIDLTRKAIDQFGMPPKSCAIAAQHEAGHLITALAMGGIFSKAYVRQDSDGYWGGFSSVHVDGVHICGHVDVKQNPARAWLLTLIRASGVAGEMVCGNYHPASSTDEMMLVGGVAATLANQAGVDPAQVMNALLGTSMQLIERNREAFDELTRRLEATKVLTYQDIAELRIEQIDLAVLVPTSFSLAKEGA